MRFSCIVHSSDIIHVAIRHVPPEWDLALVNEFVASRGLCYVSTEKRLMIRRLRE